MRGRLWSDYPASRSEAERYVGVDIEPVAIKHALTYPPATADFLVASACHLPQRLGVLSVGGSYFGSERQQIDRLLAARLMDGLVAQTISEKDSLVSEGDVQAWSSRRADPSGGGLARGERGACERS
jgi:hypothetical protein